MATGYGRLGHLAHLSVASTFPRPRQAQASQSENEPVQNEGQDRSGDEAGDDLRGDAALEPVGEQPAQAAHPEHRSDGGQRDRRDGHHA